MIQFELGGRTVGGDAPVFIVAELSANHGQRKDVALRTIEAAAAAGADAIKLQTYTPDTLTLRSNEAPFVVRTKNVWEGRTLYDLYSEAMTPWEWHRELMDAAATVGLSCFSTPFDATAVEFLEQLGAPAHKIASFELTDLPLVERAARTGKPIILSTGMASLGEIEAAVETCRESGNDKIALLRCVSTYPARPECMDLASLTTLASFGTVVGLSDHTRDSTVAVAATALGAKLIEKHFILDRGLGGPDAFFSLEPAEFRSMVNMVRDAEKSVGRTRFGPTNDELPSTSFRRSLFVAADVRAGGVLTCDVVRSVRPANGLPARHLPVVLGCTARRNLVSGSPLSWEMVGPPRATAAIRLRGADEHDAQVLLAWRNDPVTRSMSVNSDEVRSEEHQRWLRTTLSSADRKLLVAEVDNVAVGTVRLDVGRGKQAAVSLTIAPAERGRGRASAVLVALETFARSLGLVHLVASIKGNNLASIRAFKNAGYYGFTSASPESGFITCERRIAPYR